MMEENITNELSELKATIRRFVNKYEVKYLGIDNQISQFTNFPIVIIYNYEELSKENAPECYIFIRKGIFKFLFY